MLAETTDKHMPDRTWPRCREKSSPLAVLGPNRQTCETARLHSINMIMNEPHVFIKGFLHNHLNPLENEWDQLSQFIIPEAVSSVNRK